MAGRGKARMSRSYIGLKTKLAAALLQLRMDNGGQPVITHQDAKLMTDDQIISLFQLDHWPIRHADGGPDMAWNLTWRPILDHRAKTKADVAQMAKTRRIAAKLNKATKRKPFVGKVVIVAADKPTSPALKRKWPTRKLPSRPFRRLRAGS